MHGMVPGCVSPFRAHLHVAAFCVDQVAVKFVVVVPLSGVILTIQVGGASVTETELESHSVVPPGPVATNVTLWLPMGKVDVTDPSQSTGPLGSPSSFQVQDVALVADHSATNSVCVVPVLGSIDASQVGLGGGPSAWVTVTSLDLQVLLAPVAVFVAVRDTV